VNFVVPFGVEGQQSRAVQVSFNNDASDTYSANAGEADPGIFAIANPDYSVNSASNPAKAGTYVVIYGTGQGASNTAETDGTLISALVVPALAVTASIDGQPATVLYAGSAPGLVAGVLQINLAIPSQLSAGSHSLVISAGEWTNVAQNSGLFTQ
jgi:uncharacterized protein (TIGR03437 family)